MNAIIGLANILLATKLDDNQKKCVTVLQSSADGLMVLINDLLDIDKIEAESIELECEPFNMTSLLERVISVMSVRAKEKNINLSVKYEAGLYKTFIGDAGRIRQIILNLVGNAVKFTDEGSVAVFLSNGGGGNGKKNINISVTDTGIGIPGNKIFDIFGKFIQADPSITRRYGGTGLGLAISKSLAEQMNGSITVISEVGVGSTFTLHLCLPVEESENAPLHHEEHIIYLDKQENSARLPILLVEDYEPNILVATIMLQNFGYRFEVAHNGQEAMDKFLPEKYSLILLDVQMPIMDGFEAAKLIRGFEKAKGSVRVPIIAMTAHALKGDREKCIGVGMDDYIAKPFNPHQLQAMLIKHQSVKPLLAA
jgi:CheY-like chemotaxis protein